MIPTRASWIYIVLVAPAPSWAQVAPAPVADPGVTDAAAAPERPSAVDRAKRHYQRGSEAFAVGRFDEAIKELEEAYRLSGESVLLFNIAKAHEKLGDLDEAMRHYRDYADLSTEISDEDRQEVKEIVAKLEQKRRDALPKLTLRTRPEGATVFIDEKVREAGKTPFSDKLEPGLHKVWIELDGFEAIQKDVRLVKDGPPAVLDFELVAVQEYGEIQIVANTNGARIFMNGKNIGITPLADTQKVKVGKHQVHLERDGFYHYDVEVHVPTGRTALVNAQMTAIEEPSKAPVRIGWTAAVLGSLAMVGAGVAGSYANGGLAFVRDRPLYNDTEEFRNIRQLELWSWIGGGLFFAGGLTGIIYDGVRVPPQADKPPPEAIPPPVHPEAAPAPSARIPEGSPEPPLDPSTAPGEGP